MVHHTKTLLLVGKHLLEALPLRKAIPNQPRGWESLKLGKARWVSWNHLPYSPTTSLSAKFVFHWLEMQGVVDAINPNNIST